MLSCQACSLRLEGPAAIPGVLGVCCLQQRALHKQCKGVMAMTCRMA